MVERRSGIPDTFLDRERAEGFGADALAYDRYRPSYPGELIAWLGEGAIGRAVDVGCGTGQVARLLTDAGWDVTGVEADRRMAAVAARHGLDVEVGRFEDWVPDGAYDLVCSGQAWHWISPHVGYSRAAAALRSGGRLALFWNFYRYDPATEAELGAAFQLHEPRIWTDSVHLANAAPHDVLDPDDLRRYLAPFFDAPQWRTFYHRRQLTVADWLAEAATHSPITRLEPERRERLFDELRQRLVTLGEVVTVNLETRDMSALRQ
mgnify:CR=1 FL=1